LKIYCF